MDFSVFKKVETTNKRKPNSVVTVKSQDYTDLRYRRAYTEKNQVKSLLAMFSVANLKFSELGLAENELAHFVNPVNKNEVILAVVDKKYGKYLRARKNREKGRSFKSDALEAALSAAGIITVSEETIGKAQYIALTSVADGVTIDGVPVIKAFLISKGEAKPKPVKATPAPATANAPVSDNAGAAPVATEAAAPTPAPAPAAAPAAGEWD